jgi:hypothetical protein
MLTKEVQSGLEYNRLSGIVRAYNILYLLKFQKTTTPRIQHGLEGGQ